MTEIVGYRREDAGAPPSLFDDYRSTALRAPAEPLLRMAQTLTETTGPGGCWDRRPARPPLT